jgi:hypothetical protein
MRNINWEGDRKIARAGVVVLTLALVSGRHAGQLVRHGVRGQPPGR